MENYLQSLDDGWSIYLWLIVGGMIIIAVIYWIRWGVKNEQFDEDIKYLVFDEGDKEKMSAQEYAKSREVVAAQIQSRERVLKRQEKEKQQDQ
jgi:cbb3-type cytochrome oxidase subunit 3